MSGVFCGVGDAGTGRLLISGCAGVGLGSETGAFADSGAGAGVGSYDETGDDRSDADRCGMGRSKNEALIRIEFQWSCSL